MKRKLINDMNEVQMDGIEKAARMHTDRKLDKSISKFKTPSYHQTHPVSRKEDKHE